MYEGSCNGWLVVGLVASGGNGCGNSNSGVNIGIFFSVFFAPISLSPSVKKLNFDMRMSL